MAKQNIDIPRDNYINKILDLEKYYMSKIYEIINSENFKTDLLEMEKEVKSNYGNYSEAFNTTDKINIMAERIITHHIYMHLYNEIKGIYPSPVSSDIGIRLKDIILCVDAKTINVNTNKIDVKSTQVEQNQNSFDNKNHEGIKIKSNIKPIYYYHDNELPVLSYIIKIIYFDDNYTFGLNKDSDLPTIAVACIPNGKLSKLFNYDIIQNYKTYEYYSANDDVKYSPKFFKDTKEEQIIINEMLANGWVSSSLSINNRMKKIYIDTLNQTIWWKTSDNNKKCYKAVKSGSNMRVYNDCLKERFDSKNNPWLGYKEIFYNN